MSAPASGKKLPITSKEQLIATLAEGAKEKTEWRFGTEHEKFLYDLKTLKPLPYRGKIEAILTEMSSLFGWSPIYEEGQIIALTKDGANISLEPGGQFELSGAPFQSLEETEAELRTHFSELSKILPLYNAGIATAGFAPSWSRDDFDWMPKKRYNLMRDWMPQKGNLGIDMMLRTSTVQVNLDFSDEADMIKKFRVSLGLQPLATALFANSPYKDGRLNGYQSYRSHIWTDTDPDRCGDLPFVFDADFGFERYVDYLLNVPMYFIYRDGAYVDALGHSFKDFMEGKHPKLTAHHPTLADWENHLTTVFPEVRLKGYLEMRGADTGGFDHLMALPAFWVGLLYDETILEIAWAYVKDMDEEERARLRKEVPQYGLQTKWRDGTLRDLAEVLLPHAKAGLYRWHSNQDQSLEKDYLAYLDPIVLSGKSSAQQKAEQSDVASLDLFKF